jgi:hypothetical protein
VFVEVFPRFLSYLWFHCHLLIYVEVFFQRVLEEVLAAAAAVKVIIIFFEVVLLFSLT